jgi:Polyketide cyclase / dehydrase and lipid transport
LNVCYNKTEEFYGGSLTEKHLIPIDMSILKKLGVVLLVGMLLFIIIGMFLPAKRHFSRSIIINTPIDTIFKEVNSLKNWKSWSPWQGIDPKATVLYGGPEAGVGCSMSWNSENPQVGKGIQEIIVSEPDQQIVINLSFAGWDGTATTGWQFSEQEEGTNNTQVTWTYDSDNKGKFLSKYMDLMIYPKLGKNYEQGLKNLKVHVESLYAQRQDLQKETEDIAPQEIQKIP